MVGSTLRVEWHDVHATWAEHREVEVAGDDALVIFGKTPLQGHALRVLAIALASVFVKTLLTNGR